MSLSEALGVSVSSSVPAYLSSLALCSCNVCNEFVNCGQGDKCTDPSPYPVEITQSSNLKEMEVTESHTCTVSYSASSEELQTPELASSKSCSSVEDDDDLDYAETPGTTSFIQTLDEKLRDLANSLSQASTRKFSGRWIKFTPESVNPCKAAIQTQDTSFDTQDSHLPYDSSETLCQSDTSAHITTKSCTSVKRECNDEDYYASLHTQKKQKTDKCIENVEISIPTVAVSPTSQTSSTSQIQIPYPIIDPPEFSQIPRAPLSSDDAAEVRLMILLEREDKSRLSDGFEDGVNDCFEGISREECENFYGVDIDLRRKIIHWLLHMVPRKELKIRGLRDHLRKSTETRFLAVLLFTRYFMRVGEGMLSSREKETPFLRYGRERIVWDIATSCLAIATKFQREVLSPSSPIYAREFLLAAPYQMSKKDFELCQRDVLKALDHQVQLSTPEPFIDEIWNSLSTLRKLLSFPDGWVVTQQKTWQKLYAVALDEGMFAFPISLLTACALVEGAAESVIDCYKVEYEMTESNDVSDEEYAQMQHRAEDSMKNVIEDIVDLIGASMNDFGTCRAWLQQVQEKEQSFQD